VRFVDTVLLLVVLAGGGYGCWRLIRAALAAGQQERAVAASRWEPYHRSLGASTEVGVRRLSAFRAGEPVYETHVLATLADGDEEYDASFLDAMWQAKQRAATLQLETPSQ
jgi:hypothetical protein